MFGTRSERGGKGRKATSLAAAGALALATSLVTATPSQAATMGDVWTLSYIPYVGLWYKCHNVLANDSPDVGTLAGIDVYTSEASFQSNGTVCAWSDTFTPDDVTGAYMTSTYQVDFFIAEIPPW